MRNTDVHTVNVKACQSQRGWSLPLSVLSLSLFLAIALPVQAIAGPSPTPTPTPTDPKVTPGSKQDKKIMEGTEQRGSNVGRNETTRPTQPKDTKKK